MKRQATVYLPNGKELKFIFDTETNPTQHYSEYLLNSEAVARIPFGAYVIYEDFKESKIATTVEGIEVEYKLNTIIPKFKQMLYIHEKFTEEHIEESGNIVAEIYKTNKTLPTHDTITIIGYSWVYS